MFNHGNDKKKTLLNYLVNEEMEMKKDWEETIMIWRLIMSGLTSFAPASGWLAFKLSLKTKPNQKQIPQANLSTQVPPSPTREEKHSFWETCKKWTVIYWQQFRIQADLYYCPLFNSEFIQGVPLAYQLYFVHYIMSLLC